MKTTTMKKLTARTAPPLTPEQARAAGLAWWAQGYALVEEMMVTAGRLARAAADPASPFCGVFDPDRIGPTRVTMRDDLPAGASRIWCQGVGIEHVYVNGVEVVRSDTLTGNLGGTVLRSGRDTVTVTPRHFPSAGPEPLAEVAGRG